MAALFAVLAACGDNSAGGPPIDAMAPPVDAARFILCGHAGTSSVSGSGPAGSLAAHRVYAEALAGFCPDTVILIVTAEDPVAVPYLDDTGVIFAEVTPGNISGTADWSGMFEARISRPDESAAARGTLQVDLATPGYPAPTRLRATVTFDDGKWRFTANIDAPYCRVDTCL